MNFIEHIIEPTKLLMTWQSSDRKQRKRYTIAQLDRVDGKVTLRYLVDSDDFREASSLGFESYPAFQNVTEVYEHSVMDALMRRLPPKTRSDYGQYLEAFRIKPDSHLSDFALLGYTGAKLPSDGFAIINPFERINEPFEFLLEAAGYRYISNIDINLGDHASFVGEFDSGRKENIIKILINNQHSGYVTRALLPQFYDWLQCGRIVDAWYEKKNGNPEQPLIYLYVKVSPV